MREIKFRAKWTMFDRWIDGHGVEVDKRGRTKLLAASGHYEVHSDTVCQFLNKVDEAGEELYEHDVINDGDFGKWLIKHNDELLTWELIAIGHDTPNQDLMDLTNYSDRGVILAKKVCSVLERPELLKAVRPWELNDELKGMI